MLIDVTNIVLYMIQGGAFGTSDVTGIQVHKVSAAADISVIRTVLINSN